MYRDTKIHNALHSFRNVSTERLLEQSVLLHFILCEPVWLSCIVELNLGTMQ